MSKKKQKARVDQMLKLEGQKNTDRILTGLLILTIVVIPLLTRVAALDFNSPVITGTVIDSGTKADFFTYYKFIWLQIMTGLMVLIFLYKMFGNGYEIPASYVNVPLALMFGFVVLSGVLAENKTIALFGQYNRHEGTITYLMYFCLFFIATTILYTERRVRMLLYATYVLLGVNLVLGVAYFYGADLLHNAFISGILLPATINKQTVNGFFNSTINNPNYVSGIGGTLAVLFLAKAIVARTMKERVIDVAGAVAAFTLVLTSLSISGFFTIVVMIPMILLFIGFSIQKKAGMLTLGVALLLFAGVLATLYQHNARVWDKSIGFFLGTSETTISMSPEGEDIQRWRTLEHDDSPFAMDVAAAAAANNEDEFTLPPQRWGAGTGRVYIWSKTIELIKQHPVFGFGMDTLAYHFPQDDPYKNSGLNDVKTIVDKPHNTYLGIAYGSGVIVLLSFLYMLLRHVAQHVYILKQKIKTERQGLLIALFAGWCAYLIQGLFNDTIIGTGFLFWIFFGVSVSLLRQEREEQA
ncbi:O-antigen ligase-like membrane protein [Aneurinibacillus soli]|uniref:O-Antigen ligase n=1 Tax=Aneurinibacillus soli TaxID=1500254 RepID=A0A0U5B6C7_9BACL|nr:O-antigen ligase family protein [Aneurinibacillus soli]PYE61521.1 O-antigen ligase-like membrane protein [Aneurinibacillus soli]BAU26524.1 O-Antigen ligase [Aneurinibacillus soli]